MIALIGKKTDTLRSTLHSSGFETVSFMPEQVPSLTAMLLDREGIADIVIPVQLHKEWSMGHILAAAKLLQGKGHVILFGTGGPFPELLPVAADIPELLALLKKPAAKEDSTGGLQRPSALPRRTQKVPSPQPLPMPAGKVLILGVAGSQRRVGCTTQAVALWHYCKALGFDPAIVTGAEQLTEIAGTMQHREIPDGYLIEGIPWITNTAQAYDCYILDLGVGNIQEAFQVADYLILVAGSKPWELQHTVAALRASQNKDMLIALSFSTQRDAKSLEPLFEGRSATVLPWMPELWKPAPEAITLYDSVFRSVLEILVRDTPGAETEREQEEPSS